MRPSFKIKFLALVAIFVYVSSSIFTNYSSKQMDNKFLKSKYMIKDTLAPVLDTHYWIFNGVIAQYSSKIILSTDRLTLEAFVFCDTDQHISFLLENTKFIVKLDDKQMELDTRVANPVNTHVNKNGMSRHFWRLRTHIETIDKQLNITKITFAIVEKNEYTQMLKKYEHDFNRRYLLTYHKPKIYNENDKKQGQVVHCLHMVRELDQIRLKRMLNWLEIQKRIGFRKIKMYFYRVSHKAEEVIRKKYNDLVEIVNYSFDEKHLCAYYYKLHNANISSNLSKDLLDNCVKYLEVFFDGKLDDVVNSHEKICLNDCLTNFKYQYEFMTNYDFDEFIFPRKFKTTDYVRFDNKTDKCESVKSNKYDYNIYDYAKRLVDKYGANAAIFDFQHVLFMENFNKNFLKNLFENEKTVEYQHKDKRLTFIVDDLSRDLIETMKKQQGLVDCLNKSILERDLFDYRWNSPYGINFNFRLGKSLFVSELTELYNQHNADLLKENGLHVSIPRDQGYCNHYREDYDWFFDYASNYHSDQIHFDLEFYQFLSSF